MLTLHQRLQDQKSFLQTGKTRSLLWRKNQLKKLELLVIANESRILDALQLDLGKPTAEAWSSEIHLVLQELRLAQKQLHRWARPKRSPLPFTLQPARGKIFPEPRGQVLIISPWNYPFHLAFVPMIGAMAAGNAVTLKPSELAPHTSSLISQMIQDNFANEYLLVIEGDKVVAQSLLQHSFDHIFFTGSSQVGKQVMTSAAQNLTPLTLELGGKNPCIVDASANLKVAARRIAWGKFFNAGQTCVAPDYLLIHRSIKHPFLHQLADVIDEFYGSNPQTSSNYGRIINRQHFDRLTGYLREGEIILGGKTHRDSRYISPTLMIHPLPDSSLMKEEIFGPILPCLEFFHLQEAVDLIQSYPSPLALYLFAQNSAVEKKIRDQISFGGGCINDCMIHLAAPHLPFGGVGASGFGKYRGQSSFDTFSHYKSLIKKSTWMDPSLRYPPYEKKMGWIRFFLR